jgi:hypothetical protein
VRHLHLGQERQLRQIGHYRLGDLDRSHACQAGQLHAHRAGVIAHALLLGPLYGDICREIERRQHTFLLRFL